LSCIANRFEWQAGNGRKVSIRCFHLLAVGFGQGAVDQPLTIERAWLIDHDLTVLKQSLPLGEVNAPGRHAGPELGGEGQYDDLWSIDGKKFIRLNPQHRAHFADLAPARRIEIGQPDFAAPH
jgi:hypothetical protein